MGLIEFTVPIKLAFFCPDIFSSPYNVNLSLNLLSSLDTTLSSSHSESLQNPLKDYYSRPDGLKSSLLVEL
jgi:hypothetical protein